PQWWTGNSWQLESALSATPPLVIPDPGSECSIHWDGEWTYIWSRGFGDSTIAMRNAPELTGPWSEPIDLLKPPESKVANAFVYAAKAHPFLRDADDGIFLTFADGSFTFEDLLDPARVAYLGWPHVVRLVVRLRPC